VIRRLAVLLVIAGCTRSTSDSKSPDGKIAKSTSCIAGEMTYLGFRGTGEPPVALLDEIRKRFPDARVYEVADGNLGIFVAERHSFEVRARHEAAATAVGWKGNVVDFARVTTDCQASFHTPMPPP